jgi:beta-lactamase class A
MHTALLLLLAFQTNLKTNLEAVANAHPGRVGVCVDAGSGPVCVRGKERFSIQSVMKVVVSMAMLDAIDRKQFELRKPFLIRREDMSLSMQPIEKLVGEKGRQTTLAELIHFTTTQSDSAAGDIMFRMLGGRPAMEDFLKRKGITNLRVDRQERDLQTETKGLTWKPEYVYPKNLDADIAKLSKAQISAAYKRYQQDIRDTATPEGMTQLMRKLADGKLLSPASTDFLVNVMLETETGLDRLKAGLAPGWRLAHKTGSSGTVEGLTVATNDTGILVTPDGKRIAITVFVGDSTANDDARAKTIADIARVVTKSVSKPTERR